MTDSADTGDDTPATGPRATKDAAHNEAEHPRPTDTALRRRRWRMVAPWTVTVLALALAAFATVQWRAASGRQATVDSARAAAVGFVTDLSNWDASNGLDDEIASLRARGTGPFLDELQFVFGGDELSSQLQADQISAAGTVEEAFVQRLEDGQAEVFTVVSITYDSPDAGGPTPVTFPATLVLQRDGGGWLVREVTVPDAGQIGQLLAPPADTGPSAPAPSAGTPTGQGAS